LIVEPGRCLLEREDDVSRRLGEITCPSVVFHGTEDTAIPMASAEHLAAGLPGCDGVIAVAGAAHAANMTHPEQVNPVLLAFLRGLSGVDREAHLRQELAEPVCADTYDAIRKLWIQHSKAEFARDVDGLLATLVPECTYEIIPTGQRWAGLAGARSFYSGFFDAFPDVELLATDLVIGPQGVVVAADMTATHLGTWMGVDPTGRRISCQMVARFTWDAAAGKFGGERIWFADNGGLLGMLTADGQARGEGTP
jgi:predicted ester cyclase